MTITYRPANVAVVTKEDRTQLASFIREVHGERQCHVAEERRVVYMGTSIFTGGDKLGWDKLENFPDTYITVAEFFNNNVKGYEEDTKDPLPDKTLTFQQMYESCHKLGLQVIISADSPCILCYNDTDYLFETGEQFLGLVELITELKSMEVKNDL